MTVGVYIPNLNGKERLLRALASLDGQTRPPDAVVVVDNGSSDGSVDAVRAEFPDARVVDLEENVGFGRALNLGVERHPAELLVFVNNDVECEPGFVEALAQRAERDVGMVAGVLLQDGDPGRIDSAGVVADATLLAFDYLHGESVERADRAPPPLGPTGGAALYRREAFQAVGGFDPLIFAYLEDLDLALRLRVAGVTCALAPAARGVHAHSATLGSGSRAKNALMGWSRGYLLRRYGILATPRLAARAVAAEAVIALGQVAIDRNASGVTGRVRGWRAARGLPRRPLPDDALLDVPLRGALRRRLQRRAGEPAGHAS